MPPIVARPDAAASALEILERNFRPIAVPRDRDGNPGSPGVYLLVERDAVVYVGSSLVVAYRLYQHWCQTKKGNRAAKPFDRALWIRLPAAVHCHYEGAFIRALRPKHNHSTPKHRGYDDEIWDGFELTEIAIGDRYYRSPAIGDPGDVARRLRAARKAACLSVQELSKLIGCSRQAIYHWETGRYSPAVETYTDIAAALDCPVSDLLPESN